MPNRVVLVDDDELPDEHDWAYASCVAGEWIFMKRSRASPTLLAEVLASLPPRCRAAG